jgi:hypothetical protein
MTNGKNVDGSSDYSLTYMYISTDWTKRERERERESVRVCVWGGAKTMGLGTFF